VSPRIFDAARAQEFAAAMRPALDALGINFENYVGRSAPLQFVWRALRRPVQQLFVTSSMLAPVGGVSDVRVIEPMRAIGTDPSVSTLVVESFAPASPADDAAKIFIFHRPLLAGTHGLEPVRHLIRAGYLVLCEFDDHPDYIPVLQRPDVQNFRAMHALQTSTEPLAEVLRQQNPEVAVFPNAVNVLPDARNYSNFARLSLFFGGLNRDEDWPPFLPALNAVAALAGERLHFQIVNDRGLFDALQTPHKTFTPLCDYETYQDIMSRCEISFMPLVDGPFNRCKSDLKFLEAAKYRVTPLASHVVYGHSVEDGRTGLLFNDARDLQQRLLRLVANPEFGLALGDAARAYVTEHRMLAYQVARRINWYRSLWSRRAELHQSLITRVPDLAV
jgi:glycosyltransferase involved in cell wall biosynthesis